MKEKKNYYSDRLISLDEQILRMRSKLRLISIFRLVSFILVVIGVFVVIPKFTMAGIFCTFLSLALFLLLIKVYIRKRAKLDHIKALRQIIELELKALDYDYSGFDAGNEFVDYEHSFSYDMDLFGEGSVFQFINRTVTRGGKKKLVNYLSSETTSKEEIESRQQAVKELSNQIERTQNFRASGALFPDSHKDREELKLWVASPRVISSSRLVRLIIWAMPWVFLVFVVLAVFFPAFRTLTGLLYLVNLFAISLKLSKTGKEYSLISKHHEVLKKYSYLLQEIEGGNYDSTLLKSIQEKLFATKFSAGTSIKELAKIVSAFDSRLNVLAALLLEGVMLWDFRCLLLLEAWKKSKGSHLESWIEAIALYDSLVSLANFAFNNPKFVYPRIGEKTLETQKLGHILIDEAERVPNDFELDQAGNFVIITGANMAGKSTFLRTVATNLILAMCGAPVCAESFSFRPTKLFSSMRTSDSLTKHESYFYAELKRLKELLERLRSGEEMFILIDEILKGTNSVDKQRGSYAALEQIMKLSGTGIIATHDLELAKIENDFPDRIRNMCFEVEIDRAEIAFDYKLRNGITTKMNASLLMEQMGIIAPNNTRKS